MASSELAARWPVYLRLIAICVAVQVAVGITLTAAFRVCVPTGDDALRYSDLARASLNSSQLPSQCLAQEPVTALSAFPAPCNDAASVRDVAVVLCDKGFSVPKYFLAMMAAAKRHQQSAYCSAC